MKSITPITQISLSYITHIICSSNNKFLLHGCADLKTDIRDISFVCKEKLLHKIFETLNDRGEILLRDIDMRKAKLKENSYQCITISDMMPQKGIYINDIIFVVKEFGEGPSELVPDEHRSFHIESLFVKS